MPAPPSRTVILEPHPEARNDAVRRIDARVSRLERGALAITYALEGDLDRLRIPQSRSPEIGVRLWQHTCFEIFVRRKDVSAYCEFNFSPSREWAAYAFKRYREGVPLTDEALDPQVEVRSGAHKLELDALIRLDRLPLDPRGKLTLALSAVVEASDGALSYWALAHPLGKADFHHADAFALELA